MSADSLPSLQAIKTAEEVGNERACDSQGIGQVK